MGPIPVTGCSVEETHFQRSDGNLVLDVQFSCHHSTTDWAIMAFKVIIWLSEKLLFKSVLKVMVL